MQPQVTLRNVEMGAAYEAKVFAFRQGVWSIFPTTITFTIREWKFVFISIR